MGLFDKFKKNNVKSIYKKCDGLIEQKEYEKALKCLDKALELNPKYVNVWNNKAVVLGKIKLLRKKFRVESKRC